MTTTDISDITRSDMLKLDIDIDLVRRVPTSTGEDEYVFERGDFRVCFGPSVDIDESGTFGWDVAAYDYEERNGWVPSVETWIEDTDAVLPHVKSLIDCQDRYEAAQA